ncbi:MAG: hypothetical protein R2735_12870, partial [Microthrixaceae bacterium]
MAFRSGGGGFELIDSTVRVDPGRSGWLVSGANSWGVEFGPSDKGMVLRTRSGRVMSSRPMLFGGIGPSGVVTPVVDPDDASVVWYRDVWDGVDLRYTVSAVSVAEDVVLTKRPLVSARVEFEVSGAELDPVWRTATDSQVSADAERGTESGRGDRDSLGVSLGGVVPAHELSVDPATGPLFNPADPSDLSGRLGVSVARERFAAGDGVSLAARGSLAGEVGFGPLVVESVSGRVADSVAVPLVRSSVVSSGVSRVEVSVDDTWLAEVPEAEFPVVLDPDVLLGSAGWGSFLNVAGWSCGSGGPSCGVRVGFPGVPGYPFSMWRSVAFYDTDWLYGRQVSFSGLNFDVADGTTNPGWAHVFAASGFDWVGAVGSGSTVGSGWIGSSGTIDVTSHVAGKAGAGLDVAFGFTAQEPAPGGAYSFKDFSVGLRVVFNSFPDPPQISSSSLGDGAAYAARWATDTPSIGVDPVSDPDPGDSANVLYAFDVSTDPNPTWNSPIHRHWSTDRNFVLPVDQLVDGRVYYWRGWAWDQVNGSSTSWSPVYRFRFTRRFGAAQPSPYETVGPLSVNLANGNAVIGWNSDTAATVGGGVSVGLTYNSMATSTVSGAVPFPGIPVGWTPSWGVNMVSSLSISGASAVVRFG